MKCPLAEIYGHKIYKNGKRSHEKLIGYFYQSDNWTDVRGRYEEKYGYAITRVVNCAGSIRAHIEIEISGICLSSAHLSVIYKCSKCKHWVNPPPEFPTSEETVINYINKKLEERA